MYKSTCSLALHEWRKSWECSVVNFWRYLEWYIDLFEDSLRLNCRKRKRVVFWNTALKLQKSELVQNAPNDEFALSLFLPRGYHELATRFWGCNMFLCLDFGLLQALCLCFSSASDIGNLNWQNTEFCLLSLQWSAGNCGHKLDIGLMCRTPSRSQTELLYFTKPFINWYSPWSMFHFCACRLGFVK
jgi:hypothetical protein